MGAKSRLVAYSNKYGMLVGPSKCLKQIIKILANITGLLIPTGWRQTSGLFTSLVEDLNS